MRWLCYLRSNKISHSIFTALTVLVTLLYPLAIWFWQGSIEPRWLAGLLLLVALMRVPTLKVSSSSRWLLCGVLLLLVVAVWCNWMLPLKLYPVLVNTVMLAIFAYSLFSPPTMIERFARLREGDLPEAAIAYTRRVTEVWCVFFVFNGSAALITALWATPAVWSLYNGVIAYLLMGLLFGGEYLVRLRFKRRHGV